MVPNLMARLLEASNEETTVVADLVSLSFQHILASHWLFKFQIQKGISSARSDDTKSLKGVVLEWIAPRDAPLVPHLSRNVKTNRGYSHPVTGALLCPAGLDWNDTESVPLFMHAIFIMLGDPYRVRAKLSSGEMAVCGDQWPMLVYANQEYDPEEPWEGLFRSRLLVWVRVHAF